MTQASRPVGGFDPRYIPCLIEVEQRHFWFGARNRVIKTLARQVVAEFDHGYCVLDAGCGTGNTLRPLLEACTGGRVFGVDLFFEGLPHARRSSGRPVLQADVRQLPFASTFHLVGMFDVLEHVEEDVEALRSIRPLLSPSGALLLTVPAGPSLWSQFDEAAHHCRRYTVQMLTECLVKARFAVEYLTSFMMPLYPLAWLSRHIASTVGSSSDTDEPAELRELNVIPGVNALLGGLLAIESRFLSSRRRLPFGTSLIAVARPAPGPT